MTLAVKSLEIKHLLQNLVLASLGTMCFGQKWIKIACDNAVVLLTCGTSSSKSSMKPFFGRYNTKNCKLKDTCRFKWCFLDMKNVSNNFCSINISLCIYIYLSYSTSSRAAVTNKA